MKVLKASMFMIFLALVITACKKDFNNPKPSGNKTMSELNIPKGFDWSTVHKIHLTVGVGASQATNLKSKISVFNGNPEAGGKLIMSGSSSFSSPFIENLTIPSYLKEIYLVKEGAFGGRQIVMVPVSGSEISYTFTDAKSAPVGANFKETGDVGPACDNCNIEYSGSGTYTIPANQTACVTGSFSGTITFNSGSTLKVCGTANLTAINGFGTNCKLIVTQTGSLTVGAINGWGSTSTITVYQDAKLTINNSYQTQGGSVENQGVCTVNGDLTVQNLAASFINSGTLNVNGYFNLNSETLENSGTLNVTGDNFKLNSGAILTNTTSGHINFISTGNRFEVNGSTYNNHGGLNVTGNISFNNSSAITNSCGMICTGQLEINSSNFTNTLGYLKGAQEVKLNSTGTIHLNDHSMISTVNFVYNQGTILGGGELNSIKVTGTFSIYNVNSYVSGLIETVCENFYIAQGSQSTHFLNGASVVAPEDITNYIEVCACNPEGIRNPLIIDTDNDGVTDDLDAYPEDPQRAYNSYFPSEDSYASIVFEDLWPSKGDYDFNDLVLGVYGTEVTNANNELVDIYIKFNVRAVGASLKNGFGWQFAGITPGMISSVTGAVLEQGYVVNAANGTELGQDSAVIIACENVEDVLHRAGGSMFNTEENGHLGTSDLIEIHIYFNPAINRNLVGPEAYNVFLIKSQQRVVEIHLSDRVPTQKMNLALLGTGQDASDIDNGIYYKTATGLPWGLLLLEPFDYSIEKAEITQAYLHFAEWAESGGVLYQDWYSNKITPGYRDITKIFGAD